MEDVDKVMMHLIKKPARISKVYRVGKRKAATIASDPESVSPRPRPLVICLESIWDRRLILASRFKLKSFTDYKLFLREDRPPPPKDPSRAPHHSISCTNSANTNDSANVHQASGPLSPAKSHPPTATHSSDTS